jgi:hypothetical protein
MREPPRFSRSAFPNSAAADHRGPMLIRALFSANPARIGRFDGLPTSDESFIFLLEQLSRPEAG